MQADRGSPGQRRAVRRAPGQLRRRRRQHRDAQRQRTASAARPTTSSATRAWSAPRPEASPSTRARSTSTSWGGWVSGPVDQEQAVLLPQLRGRERRPSPGTTFRANAGGETAAAARRACSRRTSTRLSSFLQHELRATRRARYQDYDHETPARRYLAKLDYNLNDRNKLSLRYIHLDSTTDVLLSTSSSLGFGRPRSTQTPQLPELELPDPREHPLGDRRVEHGPRHAQPTP